MALVQYLMGKVINHYGRPAPYDPNLCVMRKILAEESSDIYLGRSGMEHNPEEYQIISLYRGKIS